MQRKEWTFDGSVEVTSNGWTQNNKITKILRYYKIFGRNLKSQLQLHGLPVSDKYDSQLEDLQPWCLENEKDPDVFFSFGLK